jgi:RND family efflux transporter MFP subunit
MTRNWTNWNEADAMKIMRLAGLLLVMTIILLDLSGCAPTEERSAPTELPRNVRVMDMAPADIDEFFEISGPVAPVRGSDISAEESGVVKAINNDKGAHVGEGDVLLELDRDLLRAEMQAAKSNFEHQSYNADKTRELFDAGKVSKLELLATESAAAQSKALSDVSTLRYRRAAIKAPFAGIVADRFVESGQLVGPGTVVARVIDPYVLKLQAALTESDVVWVHEGLETEVMLEGYDQPVIGVVEWVGFEADQNSGKFKLEIHIDNPDLLLRSGVIGRARLPKVRHEGSLALPRDAVLTTDEGHAVFVIEGDRARKRKVQLGHDQGLMVLVTDGLEIGEKVVVRGHRELMDGSLVEITETAMLADGSVAGDPAEVTDAAARLRKWNAGEDD